MSRRECPEPNKEGCPWQDRKGGCFSDLHHLAHPASSYHTPIEKRFRDLPENKQQLCRYLHDLAHLEAPPVKPSVDEMRQAIARSAIEGAQGGEAS